jgi:TBC1 domain family member 13
MEQIDRDVKRTHPDMQFFCGDSSFAKSNQVNLHALWVQTVLSGPCLIFYLFYYSYQESLKNVLLIFAKLNAGIRYVQGMNEVLAPLFFVFRSDPDDKNAVWSKRLFFLTKFLVPCIVLLIAEAFMFTLVITISSISWFCYSEPL